MLTIVIQKGVKLNCTSSIYLETTHLKLMCYINGPIYLSASSKGKIDESNSMNIKVNINFPSYYETNFENLKNSLESKLEDLFFHNIITERYLKTKLEINIDIFEFNSDITPYAVMATTLALTSANIEQKGILTACNVITVNNNILIDPTFDEEKLADYKLVFGSIVDLQENNLFLQTGRTDEDSLKKVTIKF
jgi:ribonuclease PH